MPFFSLKCVNCQEGTKRCAGVYKGREKKGKQFSGTMYLCDNQNCNITIERIRGEKQLRMLGFTKSTRKI